MEPISGLPSRTAADAVYVLLSQLLFSSSYKDPPLNGGLELLAMASLADGSLALLRRWHGGQEDGKKKKTEKKSALSAYLDSKKTCEGF